MDLSMDFFEMIEKERKRMERKKNKKMKKFVGRKLNFILNIQYLLEEKNNHKSYNLFEKNNAYKINVSQLVDSLDKIIDLNEINFIKQFDTDNQLLESQRTERGNIYEKSLCIKIDEKNKLIQWFSEFEYIFNGLKEIERKLIYYTFVEKEDNVWLALDTNYSERTIVALRKKAIVELYRRLKLGSLTSKDYLNLKFDF